MGGEAGVRVVEQLEVEKLRERIEKRGHQLREWSYRPI
jgi:hypothetical protein